MAILGLEPLEALVDLWMHPPQHRHIAELLYLPAEYGQESDLDIALGAMTTGVHAAPKYLIPVLPVDDRSFAVVVCQPTDEPPIKGVGSVQRWHLDGIPPSHQPALIDTNLSDYIKSVDEELAARSTGFRRIQEVAADYDKEYTQQNKQPKPHKQRPFQLACQNVIIGLGAFAHDASFDGLRVPLWQTCEVPHVAAHECNRAAIAVMLCDAFQNGGTMEIRFQGHPEKGRVPASLRRYARTKNIVIDEHATALTPEQSRALFLAVTPMPDDLRTRVEEYVAKGIDSPERLCFTLMAQIWREIELDFLLATSSRVPSILSGSTSHEARTTRMAESESCRAALLAGMFYRRVNLRDTAEPNDRAVRVFDDTSVGVTWNVLDDFAAVRFDQLKANVLPWQPKEGPARAINGSVIIVPRAHPTKSDIETVEHLAQMHSTTTALVVPADRVDTVTCSLPVLRCPAQLFEIDSTIEANLLRSRVTRS